MILATLFSRLITLAQRVSINFFNTATLYSDVSHYSYHRIPFASCCILYFLELSFGIDSTHMSAVTTLL